LLAKLTKNILRGVNFTNLKTPCGYIVKSKSQGVCLQLSQSQEVIMQFNQFYFYFFEENTHVNFFNMPPEQFAAISLKVLGKFCL
jgi:hypothetical protein